MNILIGAHYNLNNGDRALLEATVRILQQYFPDSNITVSAYRPELLKDNRFSTVNWPLKNGNYENILVKCIENNFFRNFIYKNYKMFCDSKYINAVNTADIVFISGGHHLTDILSKNSYYKLAVNFIIPIMLKKKVVLLPQSIGPASDTSVGASIKYILEHVHSVAYRDNSSKQFIESIKAKCNATCIPDLVFSLEPVEKQVVEKTIGIALYHSYGGARRGKILPFTLSNLKLTIDAMINRGYKIVIIPMDSGDEYIAKDIYNELKSANKEEMFTVASRGNCIMDIINLFSGLSFTLAYKTHSTIFSMISGTPLVAIAYHPKSIEFMESVDLGEYAINDSDASYSNLINIINKIENNMDKIKCTENRGVQKNREIIQKYVLEVMK